MSAADLLNDLQAAQQQAPAGVVSSSLLDDLNKYKDIPYQPPAQPAPTIADNIGNDANTAMNNIGQIYANPDLNPINQGIQISGAAATGAGNIMSEPVKAAYNALPDAITGPINRYVGYRGNQISNEAHGLINSDSKWLNNTSGGQAIGDYLMNSPKAQDAMQTTLDDAKALGNVMMLKGGGETAGAASEGAGNALYDWGKSRGDLADTSHLNDLVRPPQTPTEAALSAKNSTVVNGTTVYKYTPHELAMSDAVSDIPGTGRGLTAQGNLSAIVQANTDEAQALQAKLQKNNVQVNFNDLQNGINQASQNIKDNPLIVGEGKEVSNSVINGMNTAILKNMSPNGEISAAGLLQARKDFDAALPNRVFNGTNADTALTSTAKEVRNMMNGVIAKADPSADVASSLRKQSLLYDAADNIAPKAAKEAATPLARTIQKITPHSLAEMGGTGVAMYGAHLMGATPTMIAAPLAIYGAGKAVAAPTTSMLMGKALRGIP